MVRDLTDTQYLELEALVKDYVLRVYKQDNIFVTGDFSIKTGVPFDKECESYKLKQEDKFESPLKGICRCCKGECPPPEKEISFYEQKYLDFLEQQVKKNRKEIK